MAKTIYEVLQDTGYATRDSAVEFRDNWDRSFIVVKDGDNVIVNVKGGDQNKLPKLAGMFVFNLKDTATNATSEEEEEIRSILEIRPFPVAT